MNRSPAFTRLMLVLAALAALVLAGCDKEVKPVEGKEGGRVYLGGLFYQVQLSRQLNPKDVEDSFYLVDQPSPKSGESYFGVFMRVDNEDTDKRVTPIAITKMKITDSKGEEYEPTPVSAKGWGYEPAPLGKGAHSPIPDTPADIGPIRGGLILFKVPLKGLDSRPLVLEIEGPGGKNAEIQLDV
ncbi:MAG: hypothetical protein HY827_06890 [Actinobacteria bacterium]|nr:hypothetical protein [Actinomycetota bacterium]